jgi:hypothetical protein
LAEVGAPDLEVATVDRAVGIAIGGEAGATLAERISP